MQLKKEGSGNKIFVDQFFKGSKSVFHKHLKPTVKTLIPDNSLTVAAKTISPQAFSLNKIVLISKTSGSFKDGVNENDTSTDGSALFQRPAIEVFSLEVIILSQN